MKNHVKKNLRLCTLFVLMYGFYGAGICQTMVGNSIVIFIHGDGDYLFHSKNGEALLADEAVLYKAIKAAEKIRNSEVFIFHQKKKEYSFLFFPEDDLDFYYFRDGELKEKKSTQRTDFNFTDELSFYKKYVSNGLQNILLYYGHEIPLGEGYGYNGSHKYEPFNLTIFNNTIKNFSARKKLDLIVLSTCNNGSPEVIKKLATSTKYIIASPENLHLSYMNPEYLKKLNYYKDNHFEDFVIEFAESSFNELKGNVETVSAISGYKTNELSSAFLSVVNSNTDHNGNNSNANENCDCGELNNFISDESSRGVIVYYNPPAFGKNKNKPEHSGWGCKKESNPKSFLEREAGDLQTSLRENEK